ncbi:ferric/cupric reductase transmembrane component 2 [Aspergillus udagawae]|uniref:Ferric/cupric reductase transmembrane component 2 n=1 Tax=Aspergillus udagawae TaxID=91492 RepID=A0ABQ1AC72_9EURO|nr:ferric/cupric reductase transmembrane component 2 [Aspergillus udagawae]GFF78651.1 ferric/cupric reductase transmembrane component 2 [Aspergillus udagawae]GFG08394.1 ferric/cupric reductase transmembrane component 2 [Aspergillus udagawae]GFG23841.1 ferric/cupric reductase transmembrane component 2 [Aspergillus udagawae]
MLFLSCLIILSHLQNALSQIIRPNERCVTAVYTAYDYISFSGYPDKGLWAPRCRNRLRVLSIYAASAVYCSDAERETGFALLEDQCREYAGVNLIPQEEFALNLTDDAISRMRVVEFRELPKKGPVDTPILISRLYYSRVFRTIDAWQFELWSHYAFGYLGYAYWAVVIAVGTLHKLASRAICSKRARSLPFLTPVLSIYGWIQTNLIIPAPLASSRRRLLWWTFPGRIHAIIVLLFWILSIVLCLVGYRTFSDNIYWPEISAQLLRYVADRTGILSFANIPLLWLFAGRNNIFLWATGWSYSTFNVFHRHVAWIATLQAVVHTILYTVLFVQAGNAWKKMQKPYLLWGTLGMLAMIMIFPFAVDWFRRRTYETFLVFHILFSVVALVGCFYHVIIFEDHEYWFYLWPAVVIWISDRVLRLIRMVYCNLHVRLGSHSRFQCTECVATYDEAADIIRLELIPASGLQPTSGQYYFLYQPFRLTGWENHPFTLGSWSYEDGAPPAPCSRMKSDCGDVSEIPLLPGTPSSNSEYGSIDTAADLPARKLALHFWIRPYDGWTRHLRDQCLQSPTRTIQPNILLEGPYGEQCPLSKYESVLLIAGGTGIAAAVPYIKDHIIRSSTGQTSTQDIHLVWAARQSALMRDITGRELKEALLRRDFHASFYVTSESMSQADIVDGVEYVCGRPDLQTIITAHAEEARLSSSSLLVLVCGPSGMADQARAAVHQAMRRGCRSLRYLEESFDW